MLCCSPLLISTDRIGPGGSLPIDLFQHRPKSGIHGSKPSMTVAVLGPIAGRQLVATAARVADAEVEGASATDIHQIGLCKVTNMQAVATHSISVISNPGRQGTTN